MQIRLLLLFFLLLFSPLSLQAGERLALVIGNADYKIGQLKNPVNDVVDIAAVLKELGFKVTRIKNASRTTMLRGVQQFRKKLSGNTEVAFFFYSGHGAQFEGESYLLPLQAQIENADDLPIEALRARDILTKMRSSGSRVNVMVLDACRNLPFRQLNKSGVKGLARIDAIRSALIAYATSLGNTALDGNGRNSPYTAVLKQYLRRKNLPLTQLFNDVGFEVDRRTGGKQIPWVNSSPMPRVYLAGRERDIAVQNKPKPSKTDKGQRVKHYIAYKNGTALDTQHNLLWMRCSIGQIWTGSTCSGEAKKFKWNQAVKQTTTFAGYSDWRVPTIEELRTLVYCSNGKPNYFSMGKDFKNSEDLGCKGKPSKDHQSPTILQTIFPSTDRWYWSSSSHAYSDNAWIVGFNSGYDSRLDKKNYRISVRLVRNGQ